MQRTCGDGRKTSCKFTAAWTIGLVIFAGAVFSTVAEELPRVQSDRENSVEGVQNPQKEELSGEVQERGLKKGIPRMQQNRKKILPPSTTSSGALPAGLCQQETHMMTQCRCSNNTDCQILSTLCPGSCPAGSQSWQCTPMFRGTPPPLPQNLCSYEVPLVLTECSCSNETDCQALSTICPGSCPPGSQSCECRPLRRGEF